MYRTAFVSVSGFGISVFESRLMLPTSFGGFGKV